MYCELPWCTFVILPILLTDCFPNHVQYIIYYYYIYQLRPNIEEILIVPRPLLSIPSEYSRPTSRAAHTRQCLSNIVRQLMSVAFAYWPLTSWLHLTPNYIESRLPWFFLFLCSSLSHQHRGVVENHPIVSSGRQSELGVVDKGSTGSPVNLGTSIHYIVLVKSAWGVVNERDQPICI